MSIHILATPEKKNSISLMMLYIGRHYVPYINYTYGTSGSIWEGRYKSREKCRASQCSSLASSIGRTRLQRLDAYKALFMAHIDKEELSLIRASWQTGTPLGSDYFKQKIEAKLKCKVEQVRRGRPLKGSELSRVFQGKAVGNH